MVFHCAQNQRHSFLWSAGQALAISQSFVMVVMLQEVMVNRRSVGNPPPLDSTELLTKEDSVLCWTHGLTYVVDTVNLTGLPLAPFHCSHQSLKCSTFGESAHGKQCVLSVSHTST